MPAFVAVVIGCCYSAVSQVNTERQNMVPEGYANILGDFSRVCHICLLCITYNIFNIYHFIVSICLSVRSKDLEFNYSQVS